MKAKCVKCPMREKCICIPSSDECFVRRQTYKIVIDEIAESLLSQKIIDKSVVRRIAEQLKEGAE